MDKEDDITLEDGKSDYYIESDNATITLLSTQEENSVQSILKEHLEILRGIMKSFKSLVV